MKIGFDVISDLHLTQDESFNWENKATSLYLIVAGNISNDLRVVFQTLSHLSHFYQGVFYISGNLEFETCDTVNSRHAELYKICCSIKKVTYLYTNLVSINGVGLLGVNGWYGNNIEPMSEILEIRYSGCNFEDFCYLTLTIEKVQLYLDIKKVIIISNSAPSSELFFGEEPGSLHLYHSLNESLVVDTMRKVNHWVYGSYDKTVDTVIDNVNYINNSYYKRKPYWAKRIEVEV